MVNLNSLEGVESLIDKRTKPLQKEIKELKKIVKKLKKAINYTHCCKSDSEQLVCDNCFETDGFYLGTTCPKCKQPFRSLKAN